MSFMNEKFPILYVARHGDTAWTHSGQHTGFTDIPLTADGELPCPHAWETASRAEFCESVYQPFAESRANLRTGGFWRGGRNGS